MNFSVRVRTSNFEIEFQTLQFYPTSTSSFAPQNCGVVRLPFISLFLEPSPNIGIKPVEEYMRKTIVNAIAKAEEIRTYAEEHGQQNLRAANSICFFMASSS